MRLKKQHYFSFVGFYRKNRHCCKLGAYFALYSVLFFLFVKYPYSYWTEYNFYRHHYQETDNETCIIPVIDPWDDTIKDYIGRWSPIRCRETQPYLTYRDSGGALKFNSSELSKLEYSKLRCWFRVFQRNGEDDDNLTYFGEVEFRDTVVNFEEFLIPPEFLSVRCDYKDRAFYSNVHFHVRGTMTSYTKSHDVILPPNVFIFGIDSTSQPNFRRQLIKTYDFLSKKIRGVVLRGLMKCGDNTFPNLTPMLTGRRPYVGDSEIPELPGNMTTDFFDDFPFVWKKFKDSGYLTAFGEDHPTFAIFNYLTRGFRRQPTDLYMRPFWLEMYKSELLKKKSSRLCYGNFPKHKYLLDWAREVLDKYHGKIPVFLFTFLTELSHDYLNQIQVVDSDFESFFEDLHQRGKLENTILIVMGDHGNRYDSIRSTVIGRMEENMPFFFIHLPEKLENQFPNLRNHLKENSGKMTTWFDIYELLADVAAQNWRRPQSDSVRWGIRGYSPFRSIPDRTCEEAGISEHYCTCHGTKVLEVSDLRVVSAANDLIKHINQFLKPVQPPCSILTLSSILSAEQVLPIAGVARQGGFKLIIRIIIEVLPSLGRFEGTLSMSAWQDSFQLTDDISRINRYGNQSHCIKAKRLEKYCYCLQKY